jgi:protein-tyrosine phosphatase
MQVSDIGGHPLKDDGWFRAALVFRISGALLHAAELAHLETLNLRVVVDLRGANENRRTLIDWARSRRLRYHHEPIPLATASDLAALLESHDIATEADGRAYLTKTYRRMLDEFSASLARAVSAIAAAQPAGFGCAAGKDRTGLLTALLQELLGVDRTTILDGYVSQAPDAGRLLEAVRSLWDWADSDLASPGFSTILSAPEDVLADTLEYLDDRYGGALQYLQTAGLAPGTAQLLRNRLVVDEPAKAER